MKKQTAGRDEMGEFAPEFAHFNDDVLFGECWSRENQLSPKLRSIITVTPFISRSVFDSSFSYHMKTARANGVTREEMVEAITQLAFYVGWPSAWAALREAKKVYGEDTPEMSHGSIFGLGQVNPYSRYFDGISYLNPLTAPDSRLAIFNVTFEPGCRNFWHTHRATSGGGQVLIAVDGVGWYQEKGKEPRVMRAGDIVISTPNVPHWHGASCDSWFSHLAFELPGENCSTEWGEPVERDFYESLKGE